MAGNADERGYKTLVTEVEFIADIQRCIESALTDRETSRAQVARLLGVSRVRLTQILSNNQSDLRARTIARIAHVLRMRPLIAFRKNETVERVDVEFTRREAQALATAVEHGLTAMRADVTIAAIALDKLRAALLSEFG